jgi:hypothetical protein
MPVRSSERPTIAPDYDVETFALESDRRLARAARAPESSDSDELGGDEAAKRSEVRIATRPRPRSGTDAETTEAWARAVMGSPVVAMTSDALKRLPLDHRAGFVISLMDGSMDLETIIELCGMDRREAIELVRDLYESGVVVFR